MNAKDTNTSGLIILGTFLCQKCPR